MLRGVTRGPRRWVLPLLYGLILILGSKSVPNAKEATIQSIETREVTSGYEWGYKSGVKQPLGAYMNGLSIHQLSKSDDPATGEGNPDYVLYVDEITSQAGVSVRPTGAFTGQTVNPGGMVGFDRAGKIWYGFGGRANILPFSLFRSVESFKTDNFSTVLDRFLDRPWGSTSLNILGENIRLLMFWRAYNSRRNRDVKVHSRRYDMRGDFRVPDIDLDIAQGAETSPVGPVGIEQLWSKYDPKYGYTSCHGNG